MEYVDCTQPIEPGPATAPGDPAVEIEPHAIHETDGYRVTRLALGSHSGTHVDAPCHLVPDGPTLDEYPIDTFAFETLCISIPGLDPREQIVRSDLSGVDEEDGEELAEVELADVDLVAIHTGWDRHWGSEAYLDHPYLAPDLARWLAENECHVGIDAISVDPTPTENAAPSEPDGFPAHHELLGAERLILENLTNLGSIPDRCTLYAFPLSIPGVDGAPVRTVASVE